MLKNIALLFGLALLLAGILGFIPAAAPNGKLLSIFPINALNNLIYIGLGLFALWMGLQGTEPARSGFRLLALVYAALTALGFIYGNESILGLIANNAPSTWGNLALTALTAYLGFFHQEKYAKAQ